jgi:hypothetical protein
VRTASIMRRNIRISSSPFRLPLLLNRKIA